MRSAILDPRIQAPGLYSVLKDSDYYVIPYDGNYDLDKTPAKFHSLYNFHYKEELGQIHANNYDILYIVYAFKDFNDPNRADVQHHLYHIQSILSKNTFKKVVCFDNHDDNYDPVKEFSGIQANTWFKRNFSALVTYSENVFSFPFIIFGHVCPLWSILNINYVEENKINRLLWAGGSYGNTQNYYLPRNYILHNLNDYVTQIEVPNDIYLKELSKSAFSLDLNGLGDPNKRTFEILCANSLLIQQHKYLIWPFDSGDNFMSMTIFQNPDECKSKVDSLRNDSELYTKCFNNQLYIKNKYFTVEWLSSYIYKKVFGSLNSTQQLTSYISNNISCIFAKYGDGEYNAANYWNGGNCDGTPYTKRLGDKVRESFLYNSSQQNSMIGAWHDSQNKVFWEKLGNSNVNWVDFHTVLIDNNKPANHNNDRLELFKSIKQSKRKKIYISNAFMYKSKEIFLIDSHVIIDPSNWFETQYEKILNEVKSQIEDDNNTMILTSAGMGAKYLISELHKLFPNAIYIDIGSGFDKICTRNDTRTYNPSYTELCNYLRPILPEVWN